MAYPFPDSPLENSDFILCFQVLPSKIQILLHSLQLLIHFPSQFSSLWSEVQFLSVSQKSMRKMENWNLDPNMDSPYPSWDSPSVSSSHHRDSMWRSFPKSFPFGYQRNPNKKIKGGSQLGFPVGISHIQVCIQSARNPFWIPSWIRRIQLDIRNPLRHCLGYLLVILPKVQDEFFSL